VATGGVVIGESARAHGYRHHHHALPSFGILVRVRDVGDLESGIGLDRALAPMFALRG
jgi:hypothetical protein